MDHVGELLRSLSQKKLPQQRPEECVGLAGLPLSWNRAIYQGFDDQLKKHLFEQGYQVYSGKVRDVISLVTPNSSQPSLLLVHTDRLTAFDKMITWVPYKGVILTSIAAFWLKKVEDLVPTHLIAAINERTLHCHQTTPVKLEVVVRGYLAGSMMRAYAQGRRQFGDTILPEGLKPYQKLPQPIITPTTKAAAFEHDVDITPKEIIDQKICDQSTWGQIEDYAFKLFHLGTQVLEQSQWLLVDTKYEFGFSKDQRLLVIDEVHTPDSSRFWVKGTYQERFEKGLAPEMLDKENIRRWLLEHGYLGEGPVPQVPPEKTIELAQTYLRVFETLSGEPLVLKGTFPKDTSMWDALLGRLLATGR